jgi:hypothetical protein
MISGHNTGSEVEDSRCSTDARLEGCLPIRSFEAFKTAQCSTTPSNVKPALRGMGVNLMEFLGSQRKILKTLQRIGQLLHRTCAHQC